LSKFHIIIFVFSSETLNSQNFKKNTDQTLTFIKQEFEYIANELDNLKKNNSKSISEGPVVKECSAKTKAKIDLLDSFSKKMKNVINPTNLSINTSSVKQKNKR